MAGVVRQPSMRLTATVLGAPDAQELAAFYRTLLGWSARKDEPGWVALSALDGGAGLSFQTETAYVRPAWPAGPGDQPLLIPHPAAARFARFAPPLSGRGRANSRGTTRFEEWLAAARR